MIDREFIERVQELHAKGKDGMVDLREMLKNGNLTRLIGLAAVGAGLVPKNKPGKVKTRLPDDYPGEPEKQAAIVYWERKRRPDLVARVEEEAEKFAAHHLSKGTRSESWPASWRTWCSQALEFNRPPREGGLFTVHTLPERVSPSEWLGRLEAFYSDGTWAKTWGGKPPANPAGAVSTDCKCPAQALKLYQSNLSRRA